MRRKLVLNDITRCSRPQYLFHCFLIPRSPPGTGGRCIYRAGPSVTANMPSAIVREYRVRSHDECVYGVGPLVASPIQAAIIHIRRE